MSPRWEDPQGVPLSAIVFGGRRARVAPLVFQSRDFEHGVFVGATMGSETTAAATGTVGVVRRDPMAMLPFCGYNMGDYFGHWLRLGRELSHPPLVFHVNWFRTDAQGRFVWPGFGQNLRVLLWIAARVSGRAAAVETPIGLVPTESSLDWDGLDLTPDAEAPPPRRRPRGVGGRGAGDPRVLRPLRRPPPPGARPLARDARGRPLARGRVGSRGRRLRTTNSSPARSERLRQHPAAAAGSAHRTRVAGRSRASR